MNIIHDQEKGGGEIKFSWREVWIILRHRKLILPPEGIQAFGNSLLRMIMNWNLEDVKKVEEKDVTDPSLKRDK